MNDNIWDDKNFGEDTEVSSQTVDWGKIGDEKGDNYQKNFAGKDVSEQSERERNYL